MARPGITFEQVSETADEILKSGKRPTISLVREHLGTGSPNTIHRHLAEWQSKNAVNQAEAPAQAKELPESILVAIATEIDKAAAEASAETKALLINEQREIESLLAASEVLETERDALIDELVVIKAERDDLLKKIDELQLRLNESLKEIDKIDILRKDLARAENKAESNTALIKSQKEDINKLTNLLNKEIEEKNISNQNAAVSKALLDSSNATIEKLEIKLNKEENQSKQYLKEISSLSLQIQAQQMGLDTLSKDIESVKKQKAEAIKKAKEASDEALELRTKLSMSTNKI